MLVVKAPPLAFLLAVIPVAVLMVGRSPTIWITYAVIVAIAFRGLVGLGVVPGYVQFAHLPLAWGAGCVALMRGRPRSVLAHRCLIGLAIFGLAVFASTVLNHSQPLRGLAYFLLLGEPFVIVYALLAEPPEGRERSLLIYTCAALVAVQIPLAYGQWATLGFGDSVQGTLYGAGAGAHVLAGVVIVGAFWYLGSIRRAWSPVSIGLLVAMAGIVLIADAKQVAFALPAAIVAQRSLSVRSIAIAAIALAIIYTIVHVHRFNQGYAVPYISRALAGQTGKQAVGKMIWHDATSDVGTFAFGQGPAETVSRTAYQTVPEDQKAGSSLQVLGLKPAQVPYKAEEIAAAEVRRTGKSAYSQPFNLDSFDSGTSSGIGLFGDLGLFGFLAYGGLLGMIFLAVRRLDSPEALAVASGFAMLVVLGFVLDWWEQPPITVFLGVLAGLALTQQEMNLVTPPPAVRRPIRMRSTPQPP
jgi:hypothetical protein